jgi:hypothetical protein
MKSKKAACFTLLARNPVDVQMRWIAMAQQLGFDPDDAEVYFIPGHRFPPLSHSSLPASVH